MHYREHKPAPGAVDKCVGCNLCVKECSFLQRTGNPIDLHTGAADCDPFECTLCGLCSAVCPIDVDPAAYFLERRREVRRAAGKDDPRHAPLISYEKKGTSRLFNFYGLPEGCDTVFFPGCALPGTRPGAVSEVYRRLKEQIPKLGMVLDCCGKPSHDLGREEQFQRSFSEIRETLVSSGVKQVLVACPNCNRIFSDYGDGLKVQTVYELLAEAPAPCAAAGVEAVFHDPCVARSNTAAQQAARKMAAKSGLAVAELEHSGRMTRCCGRGGGVNFILPEVLKESVASRRSEAGERPIVTYCAACAGTYGKGAQSMHVLDLWLDPEVALAGKAKVSAAPVTYLNRLALKRKLRGSGDFAVMRERGGKELSGEGKPQFKAALILLVAALAVALRFTGASQLLDLAALRQLVQEHEILGPLAFILMYSVTPTLFLPGLPMAIAAGILFGPVWGVVYAITGATIGASISFLVGRYVARDWVEAKLTAPMWKNLDQKVGEQGWKIVAVTRLVPLFPFNLLNYAYGVTRIPFLQYAVASFFFMLPGCTAFIVFSSSLPQLLKGRVSPALVLGAVAVLLVMLAPTVYRRRVAQYE
jgi:uncharacterized membrane protein YdjX (TVP38/TMEM64 family)/Fe-S oxidoreductase